MSYERRRGRGYAEIRIEDAVATRHRPILNRGRRLEAAVDPDQLQGTKLTEVDGTATPSPFIFGWSALGGPDVFT